MLHRLEFSIMGFLYCLIGSLILKLLLRVSAASCVVHGSDAYSELKSTQIVEQ